MAPTSIGTVAIESTYSNVLPRSWYESIACFSRAKDSVTSSVCSRRKARMPGGLDRATTEHLYVSGIGMPVSTS